MFCLCSVLGILWYHVIFKSLSHFDFIFVCVVRQCSNFINLHAAVQLSQQHLLKRLSSLLYILVSFVKDELTVGVRIYFWTLYSVPLIYMSLCQYHCFDYCCFVVLFEV